jgi:diaminohydroxyphosphoribosylaminopyrimidine deaminase/5-amino-6-(5-phosphoribosylamino)uracil reductase
MDDASYLERAISLADRGWGQVHPNPLVGAVIVRNGQIIGEGWHRAWGGPHAEIEALRMAGDARGGTMYVSLEPCAHTGRTPPCTDAILAAGIARLVYGATDTSVRAGGGAERLRASGVQVEGPLAAENVRRQNRAFFHVQETASTYLALKLAVSLDGRISRSRNAPTQVTGPEAIEEVHRLRAGHDAIMVGRGTAVADDPMLTVRGAVSPRVPPARIVIDTHATAGPDLRMIDAKNAAPVWIVVSEAAPDGRVTQLEKAGVRVLRVPPTADGVDLRVTLKRLREQGMHTILCEGGGVLATSLLAADLVQRLYLFVAPVILGQDAVPAFPANALSARLRCAETRAVGRDALIVFDRNGG